MRSVIGTHIMILSFLLCLLLLLTRCCSGTCFWKSLVSSWRVRGPWSTEKSSVILRERAWWLHNLELEMPHLGDSHRKAKKVLWLWYMWLSFSVMIFPPGHPGRKNAAPDSQSTVICSMVPVPDQQTKTAELRLSCKDVGGKWTTPKRKWAIMAFTWSISLPSGSTQVLLCNVNFFTNIPLNSWDSSAKEILQWPQTNPSCCVSNHAPQRFPNIKPKIPLLHAKNITSL